MRDDLVTWALRQHPTGTKQIGGHAIGRALVALSTFANPDAVAWPSVSTLAGMVGGMTERDIRNALDALQRQNVIEPESPPRPGRVTRWRLLVDNSPNLAGYPATNRREGNLQAAHKHEPNAVKALTALCRDRSLPLPANDLLPEAYRIGQGDPWDGYLKIKAVTEQPITGANNPAAVLRKRLHQLTE